ncbi:xylulokinase [Oceanobacillus sojae]|uniref:Pentose kinase n=1 Tax=Oceanobacillus sojae TaxID=582851 RepID=A0A511ZMW9_9BACI|nr:FGGY-family carbohydrate kinase [Oceanobacillus sojae]GEN88792.1 pentose kinase [Oceanobacillus sojae]
MTKRIIAYDLGTGGNKASLYDLDGNCLESVFVEYPTYFPHNNWHEQKPEEWWNAIVKSTQVLIEKSGVNPKDIHCCGISGHSLGVVPLDKEKNLLRESTPIWSDYRAEKEVADFFSRYDEEKWYMLTGNGLKPANYAAFKILWYKNNEPDMYEKIDKVVGTKDYINFKLTGEVRTDYSYASGYGVYDLVGWQYSDELLEATGLPKHIFPEIIASDAVVGTILPEVAKEIGLSENTQVVCGGVDNSCMALGAKAFKEGRIYNSQGSSSWIAISSQKPLLDNDSRPYIFTHVIPGYYANALCLAAGGTSFRWIRDQFAHSEKEEAEKLGKDPYDLITEKAAQSPIGSRGLIFNPSLGGGLPIDKSLNIQGGYIGLSSNHTQADLYRAAMEGITLGQRICLDKIRELTNVSDEMLVVGGGARSELWRQISADGYDVTILKTNVDQQAAALGAAALAAVGTGLWNDYEKIDAIHEIELVIKPDPERVAKYNQLLENFVTVSDTLSDLGDLFKQRAEKQVSAVK